MENTNTGSTDKLVTLYHGEQKEFPFMGKVLTVPPEMDAFNHYRKTYRTLARNQADRLKVNYLKNVTNLDIFIKHFYPMYLHYRKPLIDAAMDVFLQAELYDISYQAFEEQHTNDFCLCAQDVTNIINSFNNTIENNRQRKRRGYNMMPGMIFSGVGGLIAATALNVTMTNIAEADIRNADVSPAQRKEIFGYIKPDALMSRAYTDYWRVFLSLTWWMNKKGASVWYPNTEDSSNAKGLFENISSNRLPEEKIPDLLITLLQLNPYDEKYFKYIADKFGKTKENLAIMEYFGFESI